jgi:hypothetical protein
MMTLTERAVRAVSEAIAEKLEDIEAKFYSLSQGDQSRFETLAIAGKTAEAAELIGIKREEEDKEKETETSAEREKSESEKLEPKKETAAAPPIQGAGRKRS